MLKKTKKGYYVLEKFKSQAGLIHGFSTRRFGDLDRFLMVLGLKKSNLVLMEQVHGNKIKVVNTNDKGRIIPGIDGMVTKSKGLILGVKTADCLPILFYDPVGKIIGVAHAGWRGILKRICQKVVDVMIRLGSLPQNVIAGSGSYIGSCCYNIGQQRAEKFKKEFGELKGMIRQQKNKLYLDLAVPARAQLIATGISQDNIEFSSSCTSCQNQEFFSFRKNTKKSYGAMFGVISLAK